MFTLLVTLASASLLRKLDGKDEFCKTGLMEATAETPRVCCPAFCSECSSYASCTAAFEHDTDKSKNACCADVVKEHSCDNSGENGLTHVSFPPCVKSCSESLPPCLMTDSDFVFDPDQLSAAEDCGEVIYEWEQTAKTMMEPSEAAPALVEAQKVSKKCGRSKKDGKCLCELTRGSAKIGVMHEK